MGSDLVGVITVNQIVDVFVSGLASGFGYALLLLGILLVYQVSRVINFAFGEYGAVAALVTYYLTAQRRIDIVVAVVAGLAVGALLAGVTEVGLIRQLGEVKGSGRDFLVTLGLLLLLTAGAQAAFGVNPQSFPPLGENSTVTIAGTSVDIGQLAVIGVGFIVSVLIYLVVIRSDLGLRFRAVSVRPDVSISVGLNVRRLRLIVWAISGLLAGAGGMVFASQLSVDPFYMTNLIILVFVAGMVGGLDSYWLPVGCAVGLGLLEAIVEYLFGANSGVPAVFVAVILILAVLPGRAVGEREVEAA